MASVNDWPSSCDWKDIALLQAEHIGYIAGGILGLSRKTQPMATTEDIRKYLLYLIDEARVSRSYYDQAISAIKLLYDKVLHLPETIEEVARPRKKSVCPRS